MHITVTESKKYKTICKTRRIVRLDLEGNWQWSDVLAVEGEKDIFYLCGGFYTAKFEGLGVDYFIVT